MRGIPLVAATLTCFICHSIHAQSPDALVVIGARQVIHSEVLGEDRPFTVSIPMGYVRAQTRYPVIYLLDGFSSFHHTVGTATHLASQGRMPAAIVVAIQNTDRQRDFSPPTENPEILSGFPEAGGAARFLDFIRTELIPHIESNYRTADYRILIGHSFGGLFSTYALLASPQTFNAYFAISPSLPWDKGEMIGMAKRFFDEQPDCDRFMYLTLADEDGLMLSRFEEFRTVLEEQAPASFEWGSLHLEDEDHGTITLLSVYHGLKTLFSDWHSREVFAGGDLDEIRQYYARLSSKYGYEMLPPENPTNLLGYRHLQAGELDRAREVFMFNVTTYPDSANVYDSLGECLEKMGRLAEALHNYEKAVKLAERENHRAIAVYRANAARLRNRLAPDDDRRPL
ncbi:MAG: alpha/beta hydrolase-fold protein [Planctomycetota bacterium]